MLVIIGCGNPTRCDDGVGVHVAQQLQRRLRVQPREDVRVFDAGTGGMEVMFQARGARRLILVDAVVSGAPPGAVFDVPGEEMARHHEPSFTLHDFRWEHALAAGRRIFRDDFPEQVSVTLIEAQSLDFGLGLSPAVQAAAERVIERLLQVITEHPAHPDDPLASIGVRAGNLYLAPEAVTHYFDGVESVALLAREDGVLLVPLRGGSAGGLLLKQRNARGERVIHAQEFFRRHGYAEDEEQRQVPMRWDEAAAALVLIGLARSATPPAARPG